MEFPSDLLQGFVHRQKYVVGVHGGGHESVNRGKCVVDIAGVKLTDDYQSVEETPFSTELLASRHWSA